MFGTINDPRVADRVGELFGGASRQVRDARNHSARDASLGEPERLEPTDTDDLIGQMRNAIDRRIEGLTSETLGLGRSVEIEFYPSNLRGQRETDSGADIGIRVFVRTPRFTLVKGALFQCKRMYKRSRRSSYPELRGRGERQARNMLNRTPASFFLLFNFGDQAELLGQTTAPVGVACPTYCTAFADNKTHEWPCPCLTDQGPSVYDMGISVLPASRVYAASHALKGSKKRISTLASEILPASLPFGVFMVDLLGSCFVGDVRQEIVALVTPPALVDSLGTGPSAIDERAFPIRHFLNIVVSAEEE